jgi:hypothetical protein
VLKVLRRGREEPKRRTLEKPQTTTEKRNCTARTTTIWSTGSVFRTSLKRMLPVDPATDAWQSWLSDAEVELN